MIKEDIRLSHHDKELRMENIFLGMLVTPSSMLPRMRIQDKKQRRKAHWQYNMIRQSKILTSKHLSTLVSLDFCFYS